MADTRCLLPSAHHDVDCNRALTVSKGKVLERRSPGNHLQRSLELNGTLIVTFAPWVQKRHSSILEGSGSSHLRASFTLKLSVGILIFRD